MDRFFMQRASAVAFLMDRRRRCLATIESASNSDLAVAQRELELVTQLLFDVRAARIHTFELPHPQPVAIYISED
jgi:hypothetical protein